MFSNPFPNAFGLDISDLSVKLVQLRNVTRTHASPSFDLINYRSIALPHGLIVNGEMLQPEKVRKYILHLLAAQKDSQKNKKVGSPIKGNWVVASIPEPQSFIKMIGIEKPETDIIEEDIILTAQRHIPFDKDSYYIDWQILPDLHESPNHTDVFIGAVPRHIANNYTYLLESLGLGVVAIELEAMAISRAMITLTKEYEGEARAVLDLGATRSNLIIFDHGTIQFSMTIPFSGELLTMALSQGLGIPYHEAERTKIEHGLDYQKHRGKAFRIISQQTNELVTNIKKSIDFYYTHFSPTNPITHITMCGGTTNLKKLPEVLTEKLGLEAEPGNPWKNLGASKKNPLSPERSLSYSTAIGLALRAADNPFFRKDLI